MPNMEFEFKLNEDFEASLLELKFIAKDGSERQVFQKQLMKNGYIFYRCMLCKAMSNPLNAVLMEKGNYETIIRKHIAGKRHTMLVNTGRANQKARQRESMEDIVNQAVTAAGGSTIGLVGIEYLVEFKNFRRKCFLCDCFFDQPQTHMTSADHQYNYLKKHFPRAISFCLDFKNRCNVMNDVLMFHPDRIIERLFFLACQKIEKLCGRLRPITWNALVSESYQTCLEQKIQIGEHYDENNFPDLKESLINSQTVRGVIASNLEAIIPSSSSSKNNATTQTKPATVEEQTNEIIIDITSDSEEKEVEAMSSTTSIDPATLTPEEMTLLVQNFTNLTREEQKGLQKYLKLMLQKHL